MAQRGIYLANQKLKFSIDAVERKIFQYLLRNPKGATQTQLSKELNIPRGQIIDRLKKLQNKSFPYNKKTYRIIKENYVYSILREKNSTQGFALDATTQQKEEFQNRFDNEVQNISSHNILTNKAAENIDDKIIFCKTNSKKKLDFKSSVLRLYNEDIYDIAIGEKGICIILKEDPNDIDKLDKIKENIFQLYQESTKRSRNSTRRRKKTKG